MNIDRINEDRFRRREREKQLHSDRKIVDDLIAALKKGQGENNNETIEQESDLLRAEPIRQNECTEDA